MTSPTLDNQDSIIMVDTQTTHWIIRVCDGVNFTNSSPKFVWGVRSRIHCTKHFIRNAKDGDKLWFLTNKKIKNGGQFIAVATYSSSNERVAGVTRSNAELGWSGDGSDSDIEIHYTELYNLRNIDLRPSNVCQSAQVRYNKQIGVNLETEYKNILKYAPVEKAPVPTIA